ncbi:MAG TPA: amidohydrolase family protein, partial [Chitinophagaceae bacterium]|nr:amidohydrolase family protein [Chitinophagaceae bacterium]
MKKIKGKQVPLNLCFRKLLNPKRFLTPVRPISFLVFVAICFISCTQTSGVDLIIFNAKIYTIDSAFAIAEAMAVNDGKIEAVGTSNDITAKYSAKEKINANGQIIYPGFIDAHAHFYRYGLGLQTADLVGTKSWEEILSKLKSFAQQNPDGWLIGRGWDQNDWTIKEFPSKEKLDELFPDRPVILTRVDGHAAIANQKALDIAEVKPGMELTGGTVETRDGKLTGILIDNAEGLVFSKVPPANISQIKNALEKAQQNCFAVGLTTVDDCGLAYEEALIMDSFQKKGKLKMRIYAMLSDTKRNYDFLFDKGKIKTERMHVRSFKVY